MNALAPFTMSATVRAADLSDKETVARIDAFVRACPGATPFHRPQWSAAVARGTGQAAYYLVAEDGGTLAGILPLTHMRSALFGSALVSAGFAVSGGPLVRTQSAATALADASVALAHTLGCPSVEWRSDSAPPGWRREEGVYAGFVRDLPAHEDAILKAIPRKQRAEVRRAMGFGLEATVGRNLHDHFRVYSESVRNLGSPVFPRRLFAEMLAAFCDDADILTVSREGRPLASVLSLYFGGTVFPYWGGGIAEARTWRANELLYVSLMRHAAGRGCTRFDFGRSKLGTGAFAFKKNWGFAPEPLVYSRWGKAREINPLSPRYRAQIALWKKLPLPIANRIGPPIARGLG